MAARLALVLGVVMAGCATEACVRRELTVIQASYGASCGAPLGNVTGAVARACDGTWGCGFVVDVEQLGDPAVGCAKDFRVTWRCATEEGVRTAAVPGEAGLRSTVALQCGGPASGRIDVLAATAGAVPVSGLTAAAVRRCAGQTACAITLDDLAALRHGPLGAATVQIHWRCEGEMAKRESVVSAGHTTRLACE